MRYMTYLEIVYGHLSARHCINLWYTGSDILRHPAMLPVVSVTFIIPMVALVEVRGMVSLFK